ncbi:toprim domain-containing protein [Roseomonas sp. WA12]
MDREESSSTAIEKGPCDCGSSDGRAVYDDGHAYCFVCETFTPGDGDVSTTPRGGKRMDYDFLEGEVTALRKRGISAETCKKFGYLVGQKGNGEMVQIAPYHDLSTGELCAQKLRGADKSSMPIIGDIDRAGLFGQQLWRGGGKRLVITEGELDCLSVAQAFNLSWPVVSVKRGAKGAVKDVKQSLEFVEGYENVCLWFDADEHGRKAREEVALLITPGKVRIVETPA